MKKEIIIVIIIGIIIGAVVTFGIFTAQTAIEKQNKSNEQIQESSPSATPKQEKQAHALIIIKPSNNSIVDTESVSITGKTSPDAVIAIIAEDNEYLLTADSEGDFTTDVILIGGANQITISSFDGAGNKAEEILTLVYSTAEI